MSELDSTLTLPVRVTELEYGRAVKYVVSGASGLVGSALTRSLRADGHQVWPLVRNRAARENEIGWDPVAGTIERDKLEGVDFVVNLAGESIAAGRWTATRKRRILESRVRGTRLLAEAVAQLVNPPRAFISASAIGYYGDRGVEPVDEASPPGEGFLADVCRNWEEATAPAAQAGLRSVSLRIGVVLTRKGGALGRMLPVFRLGLGGRLGDGRQQLSWIELGDLVRLVRFVAAKTELTGPINAVSSAPVSNAEFTRSLGRALRRPAMLPVPSLLLKLLTGEMGEQLLLGGAYVIPRRLEAVGFRCEQSTVDKALVAALSGD